MTDCLIKRLRTFGHEGFPIAYEAAAALEAKDKRISELEASAEKAAAAIRAALDGRLALSAERIAELEVEAVERDRAYIVYASGYRDRAEKAEATLESLKNTHLDERTKVVEKFRRDEADLAAARACISHAVPIIKWALPEATYWAEHHAPAIAAARGEKSSDVPVEKRLGQPTGSGHGVARGEQPESDVCPTCDGVGWVEVKVDGGVQCPDCSGTGRKETK
jgi:hypothetical protein